MRRICKLTVERLRELLVYEAATGIFTWKIKYARGIKVGKQAGSVYSSGHRVIALEGDKYLAHRLAWLCVTGRWPEQEIDHINRQPDDNRFSNLREANYSEQQRNSGVQRNNRLGIKGVTQRKNGRFQAQIFADGRTYWLGCFATAEAASSAYVHAAKKLHGDFAGV